MEFGIVPLISIDFYDYFSIFSPKFRLDWEDA